MLRVHQIKVPVGTKLSQKHIAAKLQCSESDILSYQIERESLDARKDLHFSYTVLADVKNASRYLKAADVNEGMPQNYEMPVKPEKITDRPVIVGFGPAGMFAGLILAEMGLKPVIIERGKAVEERIKDINTFLTERTLNTESNVQYGEGGAGTFSDGKLTTRIKNIRISKVLSEFVESGADEAIIYQHRPHIGTDVLRTIVRNIRIKILRLGGEIHFSTKLTGLRLDGNKVTGVLTDKGVFETEHVLLCTGHSASDTYEILYGQGLNMIQKDFAAGVRVEHPQELINKRQYGKYWNHPDLGAASYSLTHHCKNHRGVYSFCMCPGGQVIPASTVENSLAVNGMSESARSGKNANSAILVQIPSTDFDHGHPLDGFVFQKKLEENAYRKGYAAPVQNISDFIQNTISSEPVIESSYPLAVTPENMQHLFSEEVCSSLREGFLSFDRQIPGFAQAGIMVGMESRSSSPIRIPREKNGCSISIQGLYPCGEGAGYAGGIVSSAVDGIFQAENIMKDY